MRENWELFRDSWNEPVMVVLYGIALFAIARYAGQRWGGGKQ